MPGLGTGVGVVAGDKYRLQFGNDASGYFASAQLNGGSWVASNNDTSLEGFPDAGTLYLGSIGPTPSAHCPGYYGSDGKLKIVKNGDVRSKLEALR